MVTLGGGGGRVLDGGGGGGLLRSIGLGSAGLGSVRRRSTIAARLNRSVMLGLKTIDVGRRGNTRRWWRGGARRGGLLETP